MSTQERRVSWENILVMRWKLESLTIECMNAYILYQWKHWSDGQAVSCRADSKWLRAEGGEREISNQLALSYWITVRLGLLSGFGLFSSLCKWEPVRWVAILIPASSIPGWAPSPRQGRHPRMWATQSTRGDLSSHLSNPIAWRQQKVRRGNGRWPRS